METLGRLVASVAILMYLHGVSLSTRPFERMEGLGVQHPRRLGLSIARRVRDLRTRDRRMHRRPVNVAIISAVERPFRYGEDSPQSRKETSLQRSLRRCLCRAGPVRRSSALGATMTSFLYQGELVQYNFESFTVRRTDYARPA